MGRRRRSQAGQAIVIIAAMMSVLVAFVALAIDSARAFDARRILQDSVDAGALAGADYFQVSGGDWAGSLDAAMRMFEQNSRLYGAYSCSPPFGTPALGGASASTTCTIAGYSVTVIATDNGPGGQSFLLSAQRPLTLALMQVLGQVSAINVQATAVAVANDQALTPALGALSTDSSCPGGSGATPPILIDGSTKPMRVFGDAISNGLFSVGGVSELDLAGNAITRCAPPDIPGNIALRCWSTDPLKLGATPPCPANAVSGQLLSASGHLADPRYPAPASALGSQGIPLTAVVLSPGFYAANPQFGNNGKCYFLAGGIYEWQGGLTVNSGIVSNELRPPDEPVYNNLTSRSLNQFWNPGGSIRCDGAFGLTTQPAFTGHPQLPGRQYSVELTSVRTDTVSGTAFSRESAPSMCRPIAPPDGSVVTVTVSNVPGATSYNMYVATNDTCTPPFGLVTLSGPSNIPNGALESNAALAGCPDVTGTSCSLGKATAIFDGLATISGAVHLPDGLIAPFQGSATLPGQTPARAAPPSGDLGNENHCGLAGSNSACPTTGARASGAVTPGAVEFNITNNGCLSVAGGDAYLFSGYQYNWILSYESPTSGCASNDWNGVVNSGMLGISYTPKAAFNITGNLASNNDTWSMASPTGGILAGSVHIQHATNMTIAFDQRYAPARQGARLTG